MTAARTARDLGDFAGAARLLSVAALGSPDPRDRLHLRMRQVACHLADGDHATAVALAEEVAAQARADELHGALADALCTLADHHVQHHRLAEATDLLAEALYALEQLSDDGVDFVVLHAVAVALNRCGFPLVALAMHERSLLAAHDGGERAIAHARTACAACSAAQAEPDPLRRRELALAGLDAASAVLDAGEAPAHTRTTARAHRALLLALLDRHDEAADEAELARVEAVELGLPRDQIVADIGGIVAGWHLRPDGAVVQRIADVRSLAEVTPGAIGHLGAVDEIEVAALWAGGRFAEGRAAVERRLAATERQLDLERAARWQHVQLGIDHHRIEAISETDPLTGLHNRRFLAHWLPDTLDAHGPVCVALVDLDGFKRVNDELSYAHGDRLLQEVATVLERMCRRGDSVVRLGGDEFVLVLRETSPGDGRAVLERVRAQIAGRTWQGLPPGLRLSASIGVAVGSGAHDVARVLQDANEALRSSKREGRDRITFR